MAALAVLVSQAAAAREPDSYRSGLARFVSDVSSRYGWPKNEVTALMAQASYSQEVIDAIRRPYESKPWYKYRSIFLTPERIRGGVAFWRENREILERAQRRYGVPPQIVSAIIGVETNYGDNLGKHRVIDALSTLGFSYPKRASFFRKELEQFLRLARDESIDATRVKGSYAGAVGLPQFIPSSYRSYAVDFDGDGRRDLWGSTADAVGSVGNYLKRHGWRAGEPVAIRIERAMGAPQGLALARSKPVRPSTSIAKLRSAGVSLPDSLPASTRVTPIRLDAPQPEIWLGLQNFYAITRYNHSNLYAMAVHQLAQEMQTAYDEQADSESAKFTWGIGANE